MLKIKIVTQPAVEPVTLDQVKVQLRIDPSDTSFDDDITALIAPARKWCEQYQNRAYITQTWERAMDQWPHICTTDPIWASSNYIKLPRAPLQSIESFTYTDCESTSTVWDSSNYIVDTIAEPGQVVPVSSWPNVTLQKVNGINIRYVAGYGDDPEDVPADIRQAIIILIAYWFENGSNCAPPQAVYSLLDLERIIPI